MSITIDWVGGLRNIASDDSGHAIIVESQRQGTPIGFSATRLVLIAAGCCLINHLVEVLEKKRLAIKKIRVLADGQRSEQHPKKFTAISLVLEVQADIAQESLQELLAMLKEKYCSVFNSLDPSIPVKIASRVISE